MAISPRLATRTFENMRREISSAAWRLRAWRATRVGSSAAGHPRTATAAAACTAAPTRCCRRGRSSTRGAPPPAAPGPRGRVGVVAVGRHRGCAPTNALRTERQQRPQVRARAVGPERLAVRRRRHVRHRRHQLLPVRRHVPDHRRDLARRRLERLMNGPSARRTGRGRQRAPRGRHEPLQVASTCRSPRRRASMSPSAGSTNGATGRSRATSADATRRALDRTGSARSSRSSSGPRGPSPSVRGRGRRRRQRARCPREPTHRPPPARRRPSRAPGPMSRIRRRTESRWPSRIATIAGELTRADGKLPIESLRSCERPSSSVPVSDSSSRALLALACRASPAPGRAAACPRSDRPRSCRRPPAAAPARCPGASATNVSPSNVFCRRIARTSDGSGAYRGLIASVACVRSPRCSTRDTEPTFTPEIRTSAFGVSCAAFSNNAWISYCFGSSGVVPPIAAPHGQRQRRSTRG